MSLVFRLTSLLLVITGSAGCGGGVQLTRIDSSVQKPSNVAVYFMVETKDGEPIGGLTAESFKIYEDGRLVSVHESKQTILNPEVATEHFTLLLVDMSGSVTESGDAPTIFAAATAFADRISSYQKVGIYAFDGSKSVSKLAGFSNNPDGIRRAVGKLDSYNARDPSTNLYGAVVEALGILDKKLRRSRKPLHFGTLVVFTDGSDRASRVTREQLGESLEQSEHEIFVIGVGSEIDKDELSSIGRSGVIIQPKREELAAAFEEAAERIEAMSTRFYLLGYCSPARAGTHVVTVEASTKQGSGELSYEFSADGFGPKCNPEKKPRFRLDRPQLPREDG